MLTWTFANNPECSSSISAILFVKFISENRILPLERLINSLSCSFSKICIELSYIQINLFLSWYFIFVTILFSLDLYVHFFELFGFDCASSIDIISILDSIILPEELISAIARYLLSLEISVSIAIVSDRYVLNNFLPSGLNIVTIVL